MVLMQIEIPEYLDELIKIDMIKKKHMTKKHTVELALDTYYRLNAKQLRRDRR